MQRSVFFNYYYYHYYYYYYYHYYCVGSHVFALIFTKFLRVFGLFVAYEQLKVFHITQFLSL